MNSANSTQIKLVNLLETVIFKKVNDKYIISNTLTMDILNDSIDIARQLIVKMFIDCEEKYQKAVSLFKTIVFDKNISISEKELKIFLKIKKCFQMQMILQMKKKTNASYE